MPIEIKESFPMSKWELMRAFLTRNYRPDVALSSRQVFEWQFMVEPGGDVNNMYCVWDGDRLVGILGFIPVSLFWGEAGEQVNGAWAVNWYVEESHRQGQGWPLIRKLQDAFPVVLATEASPDNRQILDRLGWHFHPRLPRYLAVLDLTQALNMLSSGAVEEDLRPMLFQPELTHREGLCDLTRAMDKYDPDWKLYPKMSYAAVRSMSYFRWRYFDHPVFKYSIVTKGQLDRPAVCVYRIEQAFGDYPAQVGRVVDFFHPNDRQGESDGLELILWVRGRLQAAGCAYADVLSSSRAYGQTLVKAGWGFEQVDHPLLPIRLCPLERKPFSYSIEWGVAKGLPSPALEETYFTKSDGDADRATMLPELLIAKGQDNLKEIIRRR